MSAREVTVGLFRWLFRRKQTEARMRTAEAKRQWHLFASEAVEHALHTRYDQLTQRVESGTQTLGCHGPKAERLSDLRELTTLALVSGRQHQAVDTLRKALQHEQDLDMRSLAAECLDRLRRDGDPNTLPD